MSTRHDHWTELLKSKTAARWKRSVIFLAAVVLSVIPAFAQDVAMDKLEEALLAENWPETSKLLDGVSDDVKKSPNPVLRLIKGHVLLVQNQNNESVCLFLSVTTPEDLQKCRQWAHGFLDRNGDSAIAYYFRGDVASRLHAFDQAIKLFTTGLAKHEGHVLTHNARGVALAHSDDPKQVRLARVDFAVATSDPSFPLADAHTNIGQFRIQRKDGAKGALRAFSEALRISPEFALALHGRGCVQMVLGEHEKASVDLKAAHENAGCAKAMLSGNLIEIEAFIGGMSKGELLKKLSSKELATSLETAYTDLNNFFADPSQGSWNDVVGGMGTLNESDLMAAMSTLKEGVIANSLVLDVAEFAQATYDTNRDNTITDLFADSFSGLGVATVNGSWDTSDYDTLRDWRADTMGSQIIDWANTKDDNVQGVLASCAGALCDNGEWPFGHIYGQLPASLNANEVKK
jgi:tetratricopeptide (TPR) repeat protein